MKRILALALISILPCTISTAGAALGEVISLDGNIIYISPNGERQTLTTSGLDTNARLSPDGQTVAFVRSTIPDCDSHIRWTDCAIWTMDTDGQNAREIVVGQNAPDCKDVICNLSGLIFSPDGKRIYFHCWTWVVDYAIHVFDFETEERTYVTSGILHRIIPRGQYAGYLLIDRRKYFMIGGTYEFTWLVTPDGEEVRPVGPAVGESTIEQFWDIYVK